MKKLLALAGALAVGGSLAFVLASCGSEGGSSPEAQPTQTSSNPYPYTNPIKREGSSPARLSGDGRYFGYVRAVDAESQPPTISFDVAQFFFGEDVQQAAEEDGAVAPGEPVSNDHYERNPDTRVRVLKVAPDAWVPKGPCCGNQTQAKLSEFLAAFSDPHPKFLNDDYRGKSSQYWVTIRDGLVVRIDEQYFP